MCMSFPNVELRYAQSAAWAVAATAGVGGQILLLALLEPGLRGLAAGLAWAALTSGLLAAALRRTRAPRLGPANMVTLTRAVLTGGVFALVADGRGTGVTLVVIASIALVLDAVDGQVARRTGTVSAVGARFDMEVDAFLILVLSVQATETLGSWVLAIGLMRYAYAAVAAVVPWLRGATPPSMARKTVAAVQGIVLTAVAPNLLPHVVATVLVAISLAALVWSFGDHIWWLAARRFGARPAAEPVIVEHRELSTVAG
jgi:phosphatidylglycerophosphate synthase